jgi:hypothetical protein
MAGRGISRLRCGARWAAVVSGAVGLTAGAAAIVGGTTVTTAAPGASVAHGVSPSTSPAAGLAPPSISYTHVTPTNSLPSADSGSLDQAITVYVP